MAQDATLTTEGFTASLDALTGNLPLTVRLYTNDPTITKATVAADFVEASFPGYVRVGLAVWTPAALRAGLAFSAADLVQFIYTGSDPGPAVRGYYVTAGPTGPLIGAWRRPGDPFVFSVASPVLTLLLAARMPPA